MSADVHEEDEDRLQEYREIIKIFEGVIVENLIASQLLVYLPFLRKSANEVRLKERRSSTRDGAQLFIQKLLECEDPSWYRQFLDALTKQGYDFLVRLIEGNLKNVREKEAETYKWLFTVFAPQLVSSINAIEILPWLIQRGCLNREDEEEITQEDRNRGCIAAATVLLDRLPRKKSSWYRDFMEVLEANDYGDLVHKIDPDFSSKKIEDDSADEDETTTKTLESMDGGTSQHETETASFQVHHAENHEKENLLLNNLSLTNDTKPEVSKLDSVNLCVSNQEARPVKVMNSEEANVYNMLPSATDDETVVHVRKNIVEDNMKPANSNNIAGALTESESDSDTTSADEREDTVEPAELTLRAYQQELAQSAVNGKNVIVCAPTGSGKTHVALKICQEHLRRSTSSDRRRVVFLVNQVALVDQQWNMFKKYLSQYKSKGLSGDNQTIKVPLALLAPKYDIIILTAQILLDALQDPDKTSHFSLMSFSLMIFDECHHTKKLHPYNAIMALYLDQKLGGKAVHLPQVVGLTASMGVGKSKNVDSAVNYILKLCANLDIEDLATVEVNKKELMDHVSVPVNETKTVHGREDDPFKDIMSKLMSVIEQRMKQCYAENEGTCMYEVTAADFKSPPERGSDQYTQWASKLQKKVALIAEMKLRRQFHAPINHLRIYNDALIINADSRTKDALQYIRKEFGRKSRAHHDDVDKWLDELFSAEEGQLDISMHGQENPKLLELKSMILEAYEKKEDSRGIIFAKTRALTTALCNWMSEDQQLQHLKPTPLTGANVAQDKAGMTQKQQVDALSYFKDGRHKIIIATSVAEEGLDIRKCNLVIRYDYATNEIAMVQARGRGRAEDSKYVLLADSSRGTAEKEQLNIIREVMMKKAVMQIKQMDMESFKTEVKKFQDEAKIERDMLALSKSQARHYSEEEYEIRCLKCDQLACYSSDLRLVQGTHHTVIDEDFDSRSAVEPHHNPINYDEFEKKGKLYCKKCHGDWGIIALYKGVQIPVIKSSGFIFVNTVTEERNLCSKWKKKPFQVVEISIEELRKKVNSASRMVSE